jgi:hypothetical protein
MNCLRFPVLAPFISSDGKRLPTLGADTIRAKQGDRKFLAPSATGACDLKR